MIHPWHDLSPGADAPREMTVVVEIPRGSRNKYELNKETGLFRLDRVLYSAVHYPGEYGFFPQTYADDDDPLDALVMTTVPTFPGCSIDVRPLALFRMLDKGDMDEKVLCVPSRDPLYAEMQSLRDVPAHYLREVEHFFTSYKTLEGGVVESLGWADRSAAWEAIEHTLRRYALREETDRAPSAVPEPAASSNAP